MPKLCRTRLIIFVGFLISFAITSSAFLAQLRAQANSQDNFPPTERKEVGTKWKVTGKVTSTLLRPLSGVKVYLTRGMYYQPMGNNRSLNLSDPVVTDFGGNFEIDVQEGFKLLFVTPGLAPLTVEVPSGSGLEVQMESGRSVSGTVTLPSGEPLANATLVPLNWIVPRIAQGDKPNPYIRCQKFFYGGLPEFGKPWAVKTDASGKFTLTNLPTDYRVGLLVKAQGWKEEIVFVRPKDDVAPADFEKQILFENDFEYPVEPCSLLKIKATDEDGNTTPIAEVSVHLDMETGNIFASRRTESFNSAQISLSRKAIPQGSIAYIQPKDSERLLGVRIKLPPNDDIEITEKEVTFRPGHTIRGRVVSDESGEPIEGVKLK